MTKIWKYTLENTKNSFEVPCLYADENKETAYNIEKQILYFGTQDGLPTIWMMVDEDSPKQNITIELFSTGEPCPKEGYIATVLLMFDTLVLHAFLVK
jgi:hypothetical protein